MQKRLNKTLNLNRAQPVSWASFSRFDQSEGVNLPISSSLLFLAFVFSFKTLRLDRPLNAACQRSVFLVHYPIQTAYLNYCHCLCACHPTKGSTSLDADHSKHSPKETTEVRKAVILPVLCLPSGNVQHKRKRCSLTKMGGIALHTRHMHTYTRT